MRLGPDTFVKRLASTGVFTHDKVTYRVGAPYGFDEVLVIVDGDKLTVTDVDGEILIEHTRPD